MAIEVPTEADLIELIDRFCSRHNVKPSTFGRMAIGDGNLVSNLQAGRSPTLKVVQRVVNFMADHDAANSGVPETAETGNGEKISAAQQEQAA